MSQQILALAGIFQAAELVRQAANHGTWSGYAATACLDSLFRLEADTPEAVYGGKEKVRLGLETLLGVLSGEVQQPELLHHVAGLVQLQRKFLRNAPMLVQVEHALEAISYKADKLELHERQDLQAAEIAKLYQDTISYMSPQIIVQGRPQHLQNPRIVNWIRTLLFAGLRSAVLWQQLGGGRFSLLFGRRKMLEEANHLLTG